MTSLHWSVDGTRAEQPDFDRSLRSILTDAYRSDSQASGETRLTHSYAVLPRFWRGYRNHASSLETGRVTIARRLVGSRWRYETISADDTSGETTRIHLESYDNELRTIAGGWRLQTTNDSGDLYAGYEARGVIEDQSPTRRLVVEVNDTQIPIAEINPDMPLTFHAALFDVVPALAARSPERPVRFALLDEGQRIAVACTVTRIGRTVVEPAGDLEGYCVSGRGHEPSYWWVDTSGVIALVGSTFRTLVLSPPQSESTG